MPNMRRAIAAAVALPLALALAACLFMPGKFQSTLTVRADRSFTYSYKGEVVAIDIAGKMGKSLSELGDAASDSSEDADADETDPQEAQAKKDAEYLQIAEQVRKEAGYDVVEYRGDGIFYVEYALTGTLTHNFVFPYNQDAGLLFPFVAIELRGKDGIRVKAPGFAKAEGKGMMGGEDGGNDRIGGTFTLTTDAEIVSQNNEDGAVASAGGKSITWKIDARTDDAPMAVLKVAGL